MPTVRELKAALDDLGVTYPKKARKAELEALHAAADKTPPRLRGVVAAAQAYADGGGTYEGVVEAAEQAGAKVAFAPGPLYWPDWAERVDTLPPSLQKRHVLKRGVNGGKPPGRPPRGTRWVTGTMPEWLKEL